MKGELVPRKAGWDTHGLPVEIEVEKMLGLDGKDQIEQYGIDPFIRKCKDSVWKYEGMWRTFSDQVGFWADMEDNAEEIRHDVLADSLSFDAADGYVKEWKINGETVTLGVKKN